jgi:hypothetical protein
MPHRMTKPKRRHLPRTEVRRTQPRRTSRRSWGCVPSDAEATAGRCRLASELASEDCLVEAYTSQSAEMPDAVRGAVIPLWNLTSPSRRLHRSATADVTASPPPSRDRSRGEGCSRGSQRPRPLCASPGRSQTCRRASNCHQSLPTRCCCQHRVDPTDPKVGADPRADARRPTRTSSREMRGRAKPSKPETPFPRTAETAVGAPRPLPTAPVAVQARCEARVGARGLDINPHSKL